MSGYSSHDIQEIHSEHFSDSSISDKFHFWVFFGFIVAIYIVLSYISDQFILGEDVYIRSFADQLTVEAILDMRERYWWLNYAFIPITLISKISFVTICLSIGSVLTTFDFKFKTIFKVVLLAEGVFIIAQIVYLYNLSQHLDILTIETSLNYFPLSLISIYGVDNVVSWLHYPLYTLNFFEVLYILLISWLLSKQWKSNFVESLNIVLPSYGLGLLLWVVLVVFLTLQIS